MSCLWIGCGSQFTWTVYCQKRPTCDGKQVWTVRWCCSKNCLGTSTGWSSFHAITTDNRWSWVNTASDFPSKTFRSITSQCSFLFVAAYQKGGATPSLVHRSRKQAIYVGQWRMCLLVQFLLTQSTVHLRKDSLNTSLGSCHWWEPVARIQVLSSCFISDGRISFFPLIQFPEAE